MPSAARIFPAGCGIKEPKLGVAAILLSFACLPTTLHLLFLFPNPFCIPPAPLVNNRIQSQLQLYIVHFPAMKRRYVNTRFPSIPTNYIPGMTRVQLLVPARRTETHHRRHPH